jgi:hypothetical protein
MKPYVICHMCTTIDGKILGGRWGKLPGGKDSATLFDRKSGNVPVEPWKSVRIGLDMVGCEAAFGARHVAPDALAFLLTKETTQSLPAGVLRCAIDSMFIWRREGRGGGRSLSRL